MNHIWKVIEDDCCTWWVAADTEDEAVAFLKEIEVPGEESGGLSIEKLADDRLMSVSVPDDDAWEGDLPEGGLLQGRVGPEPPAVTASCKAWAALFRTPGVLACSEY